MLDVCIIGGGPVGIFSIFSCGMQSLNCAIVDGFNELGGQCKFLYKNKNIYDIPGFVSITGEELVENLCEQASVFNPEIHLNSFVESIQKVDGGFSIKLQNKSIMAKSVIVATGGGNFKPNKLAFDHANVVYFPDDLSIFKNKTVSIVGSGDTAFDYVMSLAHISKKLYLIHRRNTIKAHQDSYKKIQELEKSGKIEIKIPYNIKNFDRNNELEIYYEEKSEYIQSDYVIPCLGLQSDSGFLSSWGLDLFRNKIIVHPTTMQTSCKGIYAIGDCAHYPNKKKLILTGLSEATQAASDIMKYLNPNKVLYSAHSTSFFA